MSFLGFAISDRIRTCEPASIALAGSTGWSTCVPISLSGTEKPSFVLVVVTAQVHQGQQQGNQQAERDAREQQEHGTLRGTLDSLVAATVAACPRRHAPCG